MRASIVVQRTRGQRLVTIENPLTGDNFVLGIDAVQFVEVRHWYQGDPGATVSWEIRHGATRDAAGTLIVSGVTSTTAGASITSGFASSPVSGDEVWLAVTGVTGVVLVFEAVARVLL